MPILHVPRYCLEIEIKIYDLLDLSAVILADLYARIRADLHRVNPVNPVNFLYMVNYYKKPSCWVGPRMADRVPAGAVADGGRPSDRRGAGPVQPGHRDRELRPHGATRAASLEGPRCLGGGRTLERHQRVVRVLRGALHHPPGRDGTQDLGSGGARATPPGRASAARGDRRAGPGGEPPLRLANALRPGLRRGHPALPRERRREDR